MIDPVNERDADAATSDSISVFNSAGFIVLLCYLRSNDVNLCRQLLNRERVLSNGFIACLN